MATVTRSCKSGAQREGDRVTDILERPVDKMLTAVNDEPACFLGLTYRCSFTYNTELMQLSSSQKDLSYGEVQSQQHLHDWENCAAS